MNEMNEQYFKITKINKLHEVNNDMVHNYYYNKDKLKEFYEFCNKTINNYNRII